MVGYKSFSTMEVTILIVACFIASISLALVAYVIRKLTSIVEDLSLKVKASNATEYAAAKVEIDEDKDFEEDDDEDDLIGISDASVEELSGAKIQVLRE